MATKAQSATTMQNSTNAPKPASLAIRGDASHHTATAATTPSKMPDQAPQIDTLRILEGANGDPSRRRQEGQDQHDFEHTGAFDQIRKA
jgi:hypothetical protein